MTMTKRLLGAGVLALLSACGVTHKWAPPAGVDASAYEQQAARCRLFAKNGLMVQGDKAPGLMGNNTANGFAYVPTQNTGWFSAGAKQDDFNDCMAASGWHATD